MGILVGVCLHPSLREYPGCIPDTSSCRACPSGARGEVEVASGEAEAASCRAGEATGGLGAEEAASEVEVGAGQGANLIMS
jgi:hypothetical protein